MERVNWPSIESFRHVIKSNTYHNFGDILYKGKVKLHGTNAGIRNDNGTLVAQSRKRDITVGDDNAGFAAQVEADKEALLMIIPEGCTVWGEWIGPGIMRGTATASIPNKAWMVFGITYKDNLISCPNHIDLLMTDIENGYPDWVHIIPWHNNVQVQFNDPGPAIKQITEDVMNIEKCDPYISGLFDVDGVGEGVVMYPIGDKFKDRELCSRFMFKVKGEKHTVKQTKQLVEVDFEQIATIKAFTDTFVTEGRMEQCLAETGAERGLPQDIGKMLKWMGGDIKKESVLELEENGRAWKGMAKPVATAARLLFMKDEI